MDPAIASLLVEVLRMTGERRSERHRLNEMREIREMELQFDKTNASLQRFHERTMNENHQQFLLNQEEERTKRSMEGYAQQMKIEGTYEQKQANTIAQREHEMDLHKLNAGARTEVAQIDARGRIAQGLLGLMGSQAMSSAGTAQPGGMPFAQTEATTDETAALFAKGFADYAKESFDIKNPILRLTRVPDGKFLHDGLTDDEDRSLQLLRNYTSELKTKAQLGEWRGEQLTPQQRRAAAFGAAEGYRTLESWTGYMQDTDVLKGDILGEIKKGLNAIQIPLGMLYEDQRGTIFENEISGQLLPGSVPTVNGSAEQSLRAAQMFNELAGGLGINVGTGQAPAPIGTAPMNVAQPTVQPRALNLRGPYSRQ